MLDPVMLDNLSLLKNLKAIEEITLSAPRNPRNIDLVTLPTNLQHLRILKIKRPSSISNLAKISLPSFGIFPFDELLLTTTAEVDFIFTQIK